MGGFKNPLSLKQEWVGKPTGPIGRKDGQGADNNGGDDGSASSSGQSSPRTANVVIRASVEHIGLVGDTELTVTVKWPASTFCIQPAAEQSVASPVDDSQNVPGNGPLANMGILHGESTSPTTAAPKSTPSGEKSEEETTE
jgi:hypothetical protein